MDLPFDFNGPSAAGKNKSVKLYSEEPVGSPLCGDLFQVDICHDGWSKFGSQREGKR